jgi:hypothetical protein
MHIEFELICSLLERFFVNYHFVSIDKMLFQLMRENSFNWIDLVRVADFLDGLGDLSVSISRFDDS